MMVTTARASEAMKVIVSTRPKVSARRSGAHRLASVASLLRTPDRRHPTGPAYESQPGRSSTPFTGGHRQWLPGHHHLLEVDCPSRALGRRTGCQRHQVGMDRGAIDDRVPPFV